MNYYKRHLGDYARKAGHLSMLEHGAYNLILDAYYDRETAPTRQEAIRYARARTEDEIRAVDVVLTEFFTEVDGRFRQSRVEEEFASAMETAGRNRANGSRGGRPRKGTQTEPTQEPKETESVISGFEVESQTKGNPLIHQSTNPEKQKSLVRQAARFPEFWEAYPVKKGKAEAEAKWKARGLDAIADRIIADVQARKASDRQWLDGYAPHGSTYVNGRGWEDEIETRKVNGSGASSGYVPLPGEF